MRIKTLLPLPFRELLDTAPFPAPSLFQRVPADRKIIQDFTGGASPHPWPHREGFGVATTIPEGNNPGKDTILTGFTEEPLPERIPGTWGRNWSRISHQISPNNLFGNFRGLHHLGALIRGSLGLMSFGGFLDLQRELRHETEGHQELQAPGISGFLC